MQPISRLLIVVCLCGCLGLQAQTQSLADPVVATQKTTITGLLAKETALKNAQTGLLNALGVLEGQYDDKRGLKSNLASSASVLADLQIKIAVIQSDITDIEYNIRLRKLATFGIRHGLAKIESELENQKKYFEKLKRAHQVVTLSTPLSGGGGHLYTAFLKLLKRAAKISNKIFDLDRRVKSLMTASRILAR